MWKRNNRKWLITYISLLIIIIVVAIGITYSYFTANVVNGEESVTISVAAGSLNIHYEGGPRIDIKEVKPKAEAISTKFFSIKGNNNTDLKMSYYIILVIDENSFTNKAISYSLTGVNNSATGEIAQEINEFQVLKGQRRYTLGEGNFIMGQNQLHTYSLSVYFLEKGVAQNENQGKRCRAHIEIVATEEVNEVFPTLADAILNSNLVKTGADFTVVADNTNIAEQSGLFKIEDDYGDSYYFRGVIENNNVLFAGYQWKVIRIDGNGNVKLIYNGTCPNMDCFNGSINGTTAGIESIIGKSKYHNLYNDNTYLGYLYGTAKASSYSETHSNLFPSPIKIAVDEFYNALSSEAKEMIVVAEYCNERRLRTVGVTGTGIGNKYSYYIGGNRLSNKEPDLKCPQENDRIKLKAALITADELAIAGAIFDKTVLNKDFYLRSNHYYWTMTPDYYNEFAYVLYLHPDGNIGNTFVTYTFGVRPVITLGDTAVVSGEGTLASPYKVFS